MRDDPSTASTGELAHVPRSGADAPGDLLAQLYRDHRESLTRYAQSLNRSEDEASEVVQDVFARAAEDRVALERQRNPVAFLFRAVRNRALNRMRSERVVNREIQRYAADVRASCRVARNEGETSLFVEDIESWSATIVEQLPEKQRDVFRLVRFCGMSYAAVARLLEVSFSTVNTHFCRATETIASELSKLGLIDGSVRPPATRLAAQARTKMKTRVHNRRSGRVI
ncbi:MAG TPA: sigma-70 family RNA polymerase sigma factor [Gemmatimonadaceae bacterium]|jgi:RNA polymerase sigma-70 factor (ECF subfamily)|nr:sigma-70 family RNA polymerase sigma factor [Gemmatimonadaceae bacterium]